MSSDFLQVVKSYANHLSRETSTPVIIAPSEVQSERFHVELSLLPHPVVVGNGRLRFRIRATVFAEIPASDIAINDCLDRSVKLALYFDEARGFPIAPEGLEDAKVYGVAHHIPLRDDDDLFADLQAEERSYSYNESWLVELEFDLAAITV